MSSDSEFSTRFSHMDCTVQESLLVDTQQVDFT